MLIGTPKSGSTDLYKRIIDHPDVLSCAAKEPHWWARQQHSKKTFTKYIDRFSKCAGTLQFSRDDKKSTLITGEGSQSTFWDNTWWWRYPENRNDEEPGIVTANFIRHILPEVKLLVILRNPVDRLYSGYLFFKKHTHVSAEDFHRRATNEVTKFNKCLTEHSLRHCAYTPTDHEVRLHVGLYALYRKEWINIFARDQILVLQLEDYSAHSQRAMSTVYKFLKLRDLSDEYGIKSGRANTRKKKTQHVGQMLNKTRELLDTFYSPFNKALAELMNEPRFLWQSLT
ncbi:carbohydrate sulfotransferase 15-like [Mizuhopecten yessoensis]|uniref:carbohydrate sulfotransferase 15-like n=1 Tax=Mizuhopecten yessoensis TaxID=6573 RepID=UPI000B45A501|nr:carbohydrate sulfotransferase 15-like [Mizuhopecten yessoensis]